MKLQLIILAYAISSALGDNFSTYPSVAKTASINGFADKIYGDLPSCAQPCVKEDTGNTPCPYWDTGCLCVMLNWGAEVAECIAENCKGSEVVAATSLATSLCSSAGVYSPYWLLSDSDLSSLSAAAAAAADATTTADETSSSTSSSSVASTTEEPSASSEEHTTLVTSSSSASESKSESDIAQETTSEVSSAPTSESSSSEEKVLSLATSEAPQTSTAESASTSSLELSVSVSAQEGEAASLRNGGVLLGLVAVPIMALF